MPISRKPRSRKSSSGKPGRRATLESGGTSKSPFPSLRSKPESPSDGEAAELTVLQKSSETIRARVDCDLKLPGREFVKLILDALDDIDRRLAKIEARK
jgi:hypothetical protein